MIFTFSWKNDDDIYDYNNYDNNDNNNNGSKAFNYVITHNNHDVYNIDANKNFSAFKISS